MRGVLILLLGLTLLGQEPKLYRWKDSEGKEHVTNTPPPGGATPLDVPPLENKKEPEHASSSAAPTQAQNRKNLNAWEESWRILGIQLREARAKKDLPALERATTQVMRKALWGDGLWALATLPVAALALVTLLGWWGGGAVRGPAGHLITVLAFLVGLGLAHLCLGRFVYTPQAQRLRDAAVALQAQLVDPGTTPSEAFRNLEALGVSREEGLHPTAPPWRFPKWVMAFRQALHQAMVNP